MRATTLTKSDDSKGILGIGDLFECYREMAAMDGAELRSGWGSRRKVWYVWRVP